MRLKFEFECPGTYGVQFTRRRHTVPATTHGAGYPTSDGVFAPIFDNVVCAEFADIVNDQTNCVFI